MKTALTAHQTPIRTRLSCRHFVQVIARVPGLTLLNGSTVDARERRDCELHYLRGLLAQAEERPAQLQVPPPSCCVLRLRVWASVPTAPPVA